MASSVATESLGQFAAADMSALALFMNADLVVKSVILVLIFCSIWSWAIILSKRGQLAKLNRRADRFEDSFWSGEPLDKMAVARALARIADRVIEAGGRKLRPHDLRRTTRTIMSRIGIAPHVAERCLNHLDANVLARVYDGHDHRAAMVEAWDKVGAHLSALRAGGAEVIPLRA